MTRKKYWLLNVCWLSFLYVLLEVFYKYESWVFDYSWHYKAEKLWQIATIVAGVSAVVYYILLELLKVFKKN